MIPFPIPPEHGQEIFANAVTESVRRRESDPDAQERLLSEAAQRELLRAMFADRKQPAWLMDLFAKTKERREHNV